MMTSLPSETAAEVKRAAGSRGAHTPSADILRPMVEHASFVPSDLESPRYGLPSGDYMRRFRKAAQADDGAAGGVVVAPPPSGAGGGAGRGGGRPSTTLIIGSVLVIACIGAFAAAAVIAATTLALAECSAHTHPPKSAPYTGGSMGPERVVLPAGPCFETADDGAGCPGPAAWIAWPDANVTGGRCCSPGGFTCEPAPAAADGGEPGACAAGSLQVGGLAEGAPDQCCHYAGLSEETLSLRSLSASLSAAKAEVDSIHLLDLSEVDAGVLHAQLKVVAHALEEAAGALQATLGSVGAVKEAAGELMAKPSPPPNPPPSPSPAPPPPSPPPSPAPPAPPSPAGAAAAAPATPEEEPAPEIVAESPAEKTPEQGS